MSDERAIKLLQAFSGVDEDLLERCENAVRQEYAIEQEDDKQNKQGKIVFLAEKIKKNFKKSSWQYGSAAAAILCVAIVGLASLGGLRVGMNDSAEIAMEGYTTADTATDGGAMMEAATGGTAPESSSTAAMYYATSETVEVDSSDEEMEKEADTSIGSMNGNNSIQDISSDIKSANTESATVGSDTLKSESDAREDSIASGSKKYNYVTVTEAEARAHESFGSYVPAELPEGYVLEGAYVSGEGEVAGLMISWSRGMDSIMVNITAPKDLPETLDVNKTETYNEYLYEIPQAETVPTEYREVFNNPVCAWEDFSLDFVRKRMISRGEDAGDTDTPRGNFSVLYPDGVLVYFNGRGTAEEIWALFASMEVSN